MFRKGEEILSIYGYSRVSTSNQDYKTQIQKLEQAGAEKSSVKNILEQKRRKKRIRRTTIYCKNWR